MGPMDRIFYRQTRLRRTSSGAVGLTVLALLVVLLALPVGCTRQSGDDAAKSGDGRLRIVSFSPALSRMLVDLGLEDHIVGRTPYGTFLDDSVAVVGDLQRVDYERLLDLQPTHVLIQAPRDGADERLLEMAEQHEWTVGQWTALNTIEDIEQVLRELPNVLHEGSAEQRAAVARRSAELHSEIAQALSPGGADLWRGETLLVYGLEPIGVFGRQTYLSDILHRLGASNAVDAAGWTELTLEDVLRMDPPAVICIRSDADPDADPMEAIGAIGKLDIAAVRQRRVALLTDPSAMLPSTSIIDTAKRVRGILHQWAGAETPSDEPADGADS